MEILTKCSPEQQGLDSQAISAFLEEAQASLHYLHSLTLVRHGQVIAEGWWSPFEQNDPHIMFSLSKTFCATGIGIAVKEGRLKVSDPVISFFPEETPSEVSPNLAAMQVRHLLSMSTGHALDTLPLVLEKGVTSWAKAFLAAPVEYEPGTFFLYNTGATYMLSAILQKITGQTLLEYLKPRLFEPLGIENPSWEITPEGITTGGFGLGITTSDIAKFGQLYLQKGVWQGQRLLTEEWVAEASSPQVSNGNDPESDWAQGYGYQIWRCRHNVYRGDGAFGQFCLIMPDQDAVLALTSGLDQGMEALQLALNLAWKHLLSAMKDEPLPENPATRQELARQLAGLEITPLKSQAGSSVATEVSGKRYVIAENDFQVRAISFDFSRTGDQLSGRLTLETAATTDELPIGNGNWQKGVTTLNAGLPRKVAASGGWTAPRTYQIRFFFLTPVLAETPPAMTVRNMPFEIGATARFDGDELSFDVQVELSFAGSSLYVLKGKAE